MHALTVFIFVYLFANVKSESSNKICLKHLPEVEAEAVKCEIFADVLPAKEVSSLMEKCRDYLEAKYYWITFQNEQITGLSKFDSMCRDVSFKQLAWISWDDQKKFLNGTSKLWGYFLLSKYKPINSTTTEICALNVQTGDCQNGKQVARNDIQILIERIPIRYIFQNFGYFNGSVFNSNEVALAYKILENNSSKVQKVTEILHYKVWNLYKPDFTSLLLTPKVPITVAVKYNQLAKNTSSGWVVEYEASYNVSKDLEPGKKINATIVADQTVEFRYVKMDFIRNFEDNTTETTNIAMDMMDISNANPRYVEKEITPGEHKNNDWIIIGIPVIFVILFAIAAFILVKMNQYNLDCCGLCNSCRNCLSRRHSYISADSDAFVNT